ncbi:HAD family hydrolase [Luteimonas huabeiensis]|uniref:HAD family hydrolase n=1 Tax=Luteimonas huabeiensis TaxID=1244513 RepID=UPI0004673144|nr:HAD family hydrolase [Luteimonas huabeiensis]
MHAIPQLEAGIRLVGFDADDALWRSEDYFAAAQAEFERIVGAYVELDDARARQRLLAIERGNLALFGYGVKGMALSMIEAAVEITAQRIAAADLHRIVAIAKDMLRHPVEVLPGVRAAVEAVAADHDIVLITKGDLFHQEAKVRQSGLADLFGRIEIVSEKDAATYQRVLDEFGLPPARFCMVGNSLRSDIAPVLRLGAWAVHVPYHLTWEHEREADIAPAMRARMREVEDLHALPGAIRELDARAAAAGPDAPRAGNGYV